jgi:hypothetical protein
MPPPEPLIGPCGRSQDRTSVRNAGHICSCSARHAPANCSGILAVRREPHVHDPCSRRDGKHDAAGAVLARADVVVEVTQRGLTLAARRERRRRRAGGGEERHVACCGAVVDPGAAVVDSDEDSDRTRSRHEGGARVHEWVDDSRDHDRQRCARGVHELGRADARSGVPRGGSVPRR